MIPLHFALSTWGFDPEGQSGREDPLEALYYTACYELGTWRSGGLGSGTITSQILHRDSSIDWDDTILEEHLQRKFK